MNAKETASVVAVIAAAHPQWPATPETVALYGQMLSDLEYLDVLNAVTDLIAIDDRWPSIATIRRRCFVRAGAIAPARDEAWLEVNRLIGEVGVSRLPEFSHQAISDAVRVIGWRNLCVGDLSVERAHFWKVYDETSKRCDTAVLTGTAPDLLLQGGSRSDRQLPSNVIRMP